MKDDSRFGESHKIPMKSVSTLLKERVVQSGLCTHCGTCAGLAPDLIQMKTTKKGPLPEINSEGASFPEMCYLACPGKGLNYPELNQTIFGKLPDDWLVGNFKKVFIGYSMDPEIRSNGASGGIVTQILLFLLKEQLVKGAVVLKHGEPKPWLSSPTIVRDELGIRKAAQSVYVPTPLNTIIPEIDAFEGELAYVGLPDQVASLRFLQSKNHPVANKINYFISLYCGTGLYLDAISAFLRKHKISGLEKVKSLRYRQGEWPGYLEIITTDGQRITAEKFHYNYLIPFFITKTSLNNVDFTGELADISVGDAWHPDYEEKGGGYSVVVARSESGLELLERMNKEGELYLEEKKPYEIFSMHAHMLDFKKRGGFIRISMRKTVGLPVPDYGYQPISIPKRRYIVEIVISGIFLIFGTRVSRWVLHFIPLFALGPIFDRMRRVWKSISKSSKRKGLWATRFIVSEKKE